MDELLQHHEATGETAAAESGDVMARKVIIGEGITAREHLDATGPNAREAFEALRDSFREYQSQVKEHGYFGAAVLDAEAVCRRVLQLAPGDTPVKQMDSPDALARSILSSIDEAKHEIAQGNADRAAQFAFEAGEKWARATMKWQWEKAALAGEKVAGGARNSAHGTNERHEPSRNMRFKRMAELVPVIGVDKAAAQCEAEGLGKRDAIKRQWYRFQKNSDT